MEIELYMQRNTFSKYMYKELYCNCIKNMMLQPITLTLRVAYRFISNL